MAAAMMRNIKRKVEVCEGYLGVFFRAWLEKQRLATVLVGGKEGGRVGGREGRREGRGEGGKVGFQELSVGLSSQLSDSVVDFIIILFYLASVWFPLIYSYRKRLFFIGQ